MKDHAYLMKKWGVIDMKLCGSLRNTVHNTYVPINTEMFSIDIKEYLK